MNPYSVLVFFSIIALLANPYATQARPQPRRYLHRIPLPFGVVGAEDIAFDCNGQGPYVGVADGRILKWNGRRVGWTEFATTSRFRHMRQCDGSSDRNHEPICGRPLGLKFNSATCELYIADAYFGLMKTPPTGGLAQSLATSAAGIPFRFLNGVDINPETGMVYFTDTSTVYQRRSWESVFGTLDKTGRLLQYDPVTSKVTVLMDRLGFANGVSLSRDNSFLLVGEGKTSTIFKYWLRGPRAHQHEVFAHLPAAPDNIKRNQNGEFWVAIADYGGRVGLKLNEHGTIIESLSEPGLTAISDVDERNGAIWTGSVRNPYVGVSF